jgi:hypothetical protein
MPTAAIIIGAIIAFICTSGVIARAVATRGVVERIEPQ